MRHELDSIDANLIRAFRTGDRPSISDVARSTGLARGTVQTRIARLVDSGVITGWGPELNARATPYSVVAFTTVSIAQGAHDRVLAALATLPEVLEVHVITGGGDLLCRLAATSNDHLHTLIQQVVAIEGVRRTDSQLALQTPLHRTLADLVGA